MTDHEKELVARRAYGEYAVNEHCTRIWEKYRRKERSIYTDFLRVIHTGGHTWEEYESAVLPIHKEHPRELPKLSPPACRRRRRRPVPEPEPEPEHEPEHEGPLTGRQQILDALRRPWPRRGLSGESET